MKTARTRDPHRIEFVLSTIKELWLEQPDTRLGQLLINVLRPDEPFPQLYNMEDTELMKRFEKYKTWVEESKLRG